MYTFLFSRKSLAVLLAAALLVGALLFSAGLLIGLRVHLPAAPVRSASLGGIPLPPRRTRPPRRPPPRRPPRHRAAPRHRPPARRLSPCRRRRSPILSP